MKTFKDSVQFYCVEEEEIESADFVKIFYEFKQACIKCKDIYDKAEKEKDKKQWFQNDNILVNYSLEIRFIHCSFSKKVGRC